jgi:hypothetical protein
MTGVFKCRKTTLDVIKEIPTAAIARLAELTGKS